MKNISLFRFTALYDKILIQFMSTVVIVIILVNSVPKNLKFNSVTVPFSWEK